MALAVFGGPMSTPSGSAATVRVAGASPFPHGCPGESDPYQPGYEGDASLAVDPSDPRHVAAVWTADVTYVLGRATMLAVSHDGGRTFGKPRPVPGFTACTGGPRDHRNSFNPQVAIGAGHWIYITAVTTPGGTFGPYPIATTTSADDGRTFAPVKRFDDDETLSPDAPTIFTDPRRPGHAVLAWIRLAPTVLAGQFQGNIVLTETRNAGRAWALPRVIASRPLGTVDAPVGGVFARNGSLRLLTYGAVYDSTGNARRQRAGEVDLQPDLATVRRDVQYVDAPQEKVTDPDNPGVLAEHRTDPAWAPGGRWVVWQVRERGAWVIRGRRLQAGGFGPRRKIATSPVPPLHLQPAVAGDGTLLLGSYDWRGHAGRSPKLLTAFHVLTSTDSGGHWKERRLTRRFDLRSAKDVYGKELFLTHTGRGVELPHGALTPIVAGRPVATAGKTDVFVGRVIPGQPSS